VRLGKCATSGLRAVYRRWSPRFAQSRSARCVGRDIAREIYEREYKGRGFDRAGAGVCRIRVGAGEAEAQSDEHVMLKVLHRRSSKLHAPWLPIPRLRITVWRHIGLLLSLSADRCPISLGSWSSCKPRLLWSRSLVFVGSFAITARQALLLGLKV
jgi:hypothetical protein